MVSAIRAGSLTRGPAAFARRISFSGLMVALSVNTAQGSTQGTVSESRVSAASAGSASSGEIEYAFDTSLNKTSARFKTALASGNFFSRLFSVSHDVHTLIAVYEFGGRARVDPPDAVRLSLISDEFRQAPVGDRPSLGSVPILVITIGDTVLRFPLGIAQRTELSSVPDVVSHLARASWDDRAGINVNARNRESGDRHQPMTQLHIERTATAWIPLCDFIALVNGKDVHGTVAGLDFDISEDVLSGLRQFAAEMTPSAAVRTSNGCRSR